MFTLGVPTKKVFFYILYSLGIGLLGWILVYANDIMKIGNYLTLFVVLARMIPRSVVLVVRSVFFNLQKKRRYKQAMDLRFIQVKIPKSMASKTGDLEADDHITSMQQIIGIMNQIYKNLYALYDESTRAKYLGQDYVSVEILLESDVISFAMAIPEDFVDNMEKMISGFYPGSDMDYINQPKLLEGGKYIQGGELVLANTTICPIKTYENFEVDPMDSILSNFAKTLDGEKLCFQVLVSPIDKDKYEGFRSDIEGYKKCKKSRYTCMFKERWKKIINKEDKEGEDNKFDFSQQQLGDLDKKVEDELFEVKIRIFATSPEAHRPSKIISDMVRSFHQYSNIGLNNFVYSPVEDLHQFAKNLVLRSLFSEGGFEEKIKNIGNEMILNIKELSSIIHFPHSRFNRNPRIRRQRYKVVPAPDNIAKEGIFLGTNVFGGVKKDIFVSHIDRFRHFYIIGQTGTGKSTTMLTMAMQDIKQGNGFCLIDPHGDLCEHLLRHIPKERIDDLIYFDFANTEYPIAFNVFDGATNADERDLITNDMVEMFENMYGKEIFGPRIQDYFRNASLLLMEQPEGGTLTEIVRIFVDDAYLTMKLKNLTDPVVSSRWNKTYKNMGEREKGEMIPFFQAKFGQFTTGTFVRNVIGQPKSSFQFGKIMQEKKILLCNLAKGLTGELSSQLIGRMIAIQIKLNALKRAAIEDKDRVPFFLYVDEFQNYVSQSFESILSEARKYKLGLCIAHQYIEQLKQSGLGGSMDMSKPIFGNVGSQLYLKVGPEDAEFLEKNIQPEFSKTDLLGMDKYKGILTVSVDTQPSRPFSLNCTNPFAVSVINEKAKIDIIKQISALKRGTKRELVEKEIYFRVGV